MAITAIKNKYPSNAKILSETTFYAIIAGTLLFGFALDAILVMFCGQLVADVALLNFPVFFLVSILLIIVGLVINVVSRKPVLSFIGYLMVIIPIGALLSMLLPDEDRMIVRSAFLATVCLSVVMLVLAIVYPNIFYSIFKVIAISLLVAVLYQLSATFIGFGLGNVRDWLVVCLFSCYIGFDISFAKSRPRTLDNAIDSACGLYLDIVNLFLRILIIIARNRK